MITGATLPPCIAYISPCVTTLKVKIASLHPVFCCETCSLSLTGSAGQRLNRLHALEVHRPARVVPTTVLPVLPILSDCLVQSVV